MRTWMGLIVSLLLSTACGDTTPPSPPPLDTSAITPTPAIAVTTKLPTSAISPIATATAAALVAVPTPTFAPSPLVGGESIVIPRRSGEIDVKGNPQLVTAGEGAVWVLNVFTPGASVHPANDRMLLSLDPNGSGVPVFKFMGVGDGAMAAGEGSVWITDPSSRSLTRFEIQAGKTTVHPPCPGESFPSLLTVGEGFVWISCLTQGSSGHAVIQLDPHSLQVVRVIPLKSAGGIAVGEGLVWVANPQQHTITRIHPRTGEIVGEPIQLEQGAGGVQVGEGSVWVLDWDGGNVVARIDPGKGTVVTKNIRVGPFAFDLTTGAGSAWVTNHDGGNVTRIDAHTGSIMGHPISVGVEPKGITFFAGSIWIANYGSGKVTRLTP